MKELSLSQIYNRVMDLEYSLKYVANDRWRMVLMKRIVNLHRIVNRNLEFTPSEMNKIITLKELL